jgi:hypothetical protein
MECLIFQKIGDEATEIQLIVLKGEDLNNTQGKNYNLCLCLEGKVAELQF